MTWGGWGAGHDLGGGEQGVWLGLDMTWGGGGGGWT